MKKAGIFGGTFNPIHFGHLRAALEAHEGFVLDKTLFVPSYIPPHKSGDVASPEMRLEMTKMSVENFKGFEVCDIEATKKEVSYSFDTIQTLKSALKDTELFFILGSDAFSEIKTWKRYDELLCMCNFIVMTRPGFSQDIIKQAPLQNIYDKFHYVKERNLYESSAGTCIFFHEITQLDISSTRIRKLCEEGKSIKYLVPQKVEEFIAKNKLYR